MQFQVKAVKIKVARILKGMKQEELAAAAGVSAMSVSRSEYEPERLAVRTLAPILFALNLTFDDVFQPVPPDTSGND